MERVFPVLLAAEVYQFCVCRASASVRRAYEEPAVQPLKLWARQASGRLGYTRVHVHRASLVVRNVYKLWRRTICVLESCLEGCVRTHGGIWWALEARRDRLFAPRDPKP